MRAAVTHTQLVTPGKIVYLLIALSQVVLSDKFDGLLCGLMMLSMLSTGFEQKLISNAIILVILILRGRNRQRLHNLKV